LVKKVRKGLLVRRIMQGGLRLEKETRVLVGKGKKVDGANKGRGKYQNRRGGGRTQTEGQKKRDAVGKIAIIIAGGEKEKRRKLRDV